MNALTLYMNTLMSTCMNEHTLFMNALALFKNLLIYFMNTLNYS